PTPILAGRPSATVTPRSEPARPDSSFQWNPAETATFWRPPPPTGSTLSGGPISNTGTHVAGQQPHPDPSSPRPGVPAFQKTGPCRAPPLRDPPPNLPSPPESADAGWDGPHLPGRPAATP